MKGKNLLAFLTLCMLSTNTASAHLIDLGSEPASGTPSTQKLDSINIIETLSGGLSLNKEHFGGGTLKPGNTSMSTAFFYMTPQKESGYIYIDNFVPNNPSSTTNNGESVEVKVGYDDMGKSWNISSAKEESLHNVKISSIALDYAGTAFFAKRVGDVTDSQITNPTELSKLYVQTDTSTKDANGNPSPKKYVASTLYVRWYYDVTCTDTSHSNDHESGLYKKVPVLDGWGGGPYLAAGQNMDTQPDVFNDSSKVTEITNNWSTRVISFQKALGKFPNYPFANGVEYNCNGKKHTVSSNRAYFEKRYEVRRYIEGNKLSTYEVVIPSKTVTTQSQSLIPKTAPDVSIDAETHLNSVGNAIDKYTFDIKIKPYTANKTYSSESTPYTQTIKQDGTYGTNDAIDVEPADNQADVWHSNLTAKFELLDENKNVVNLKDKNGETISPKTIPAKDTTLTIKQDNIDRILKGYTARVTVNYSSNIRYLASKKTVEVSYSSNKNANMKDKVYSQIIKYIDDETKGDNNKNGLKTDLSTEYSKINPRVERVFETSTKNNLSKIASDSILGYIPTPEIPPSDEYPGTVKGSVSIRYVDDATGKTIGDEEKISNLALGSHIFNAKAIKGYKVKGEASKEVTLTKDNYNLNIEFRYTKSGDINPDIYKGSVTIKYIDDTTGKTIGNEEVKSDLALGIHTFKARDISGYKIKGEDRKKVTLTENNPNQTIVFRYTKNAGDGGGSMHDGKPPTVSLKVTPPNTLTVLEGAKFEINLDATYSGKSPEQTATGNQTYYNTNPNYVPVGEIINHTWVDNFKINKVIITAQNGDLIPYNSNQIQTSNSNNKFTFKIKDMSAKPQHIGIANVKVYYSYNINQRTWNVDGNTEEYDNDGNVIYKITFDTEVTQQSGTANTNFKIYSLSGVTTT